MGVAGWGVGTGFCFQLGGQGRPICRVSDKVLETGRASFSASLSSPSGKRLTARGQFDTVGTKNKDSGHFKG